MQLRSADS